MHTGTKPPTLRSKKIILMIVKVNFNLGAAHNYRMPTTQYNNVIKGVYKKEAQNKPSLDMSKAARQSF